ncbi:flagellar basal body-associated FliL family protein [Marinimicrobium locisalis]|uniref:flagellar basal body-associated FliL family protein n=1 Tax=Marinimicrobium locisalis TaxID=546022 RepID=UPI003221503F
MAEEDEERELTEEEQAEVDRKAKRNQRIKLIGLAVLLVLLSVGVTMGLLHFLGPEDPEPSEGEPAAVEEEPPEPASQEAIYYPLNEKLVVNYNVRGRQRFLQTEITLMFRDNKVADVLERHMPRIRNDLIMLLSGQEFEDLQTPEGRELLRQDALRSIQDILQEEIGQPGVEQVLFTSFVMQ